MSEPSHPRVSYLPLWVLIVLTVCMTIWGACELQRPGVDGIVTGESCQGYCEADSESYECKQLKALKAPTSAKGRTGTSQVLDKRLADYRADKAALRTNLLFQLAFVLLGLLVVTGKSDILETPIAGIKLPRMWMYYIVPLALTFFWLEFGFLTDKMIQTRHESWLLLEALARQVAESDGVTSPVKADHLTMQLARLFEDGAYVDGWFVAFRGCEHVIDTAFRLGTNFFWSFVYGSLLGATHAGAIFLAHIGNVKYPLDEASDDMESGARHQRTLSIVGRTLPYAIMAVILGSHFQFFAGGKNPNWMQLVIASATILFGWLLLRTANSIPPTRPAADPVDE